MVCFVVFLPARRQTLTQNSQWNQWEGACSGPVLRGAPSPFLCPWELGSPPGSSWIPFGTLISDLRWKIKPLGPEVSTAGRSLPSLRYRLHSPDSSPAINSCVYSRTAHTFFWNIIMIKNEGLSPEREIAWHLDSWPKVKYLNIFK